MAEDLTTGLAKTPTRRSPQFYTAAMACYLAHVEQGQSIRSIAAAADLHPSTVMRRIRKIELMRDDPIVDQYLSDLSKQHTIIPNMTEGGQTMTSNLQPVGTNLTRQTTPEEKRILRRLCETGAFMAVSKGMAKAVIMRANDKGEQTRTAVADSAMAGALVLKDWLSCSKSGQISRYVVTSSGRAALKRLLAMDVARGVQGCGFSEAPSAFSEQHKEWDTRTISGAPGEKPKRMRVNLRESPLATLGRKKGKDGVPFLNRDLIAAGERFREDFELAQIGARVTQNWESFLTPRGGGSTGGGEVGFSSAQDRFRTALAALGPGLGDIAMRCCCFLEGLEVAEKRMGWSARSGKIVLRIALQRLSAHYLDGSDQLRKIG